MGCCKLRAILLLAVAGSLTPRPILGQVMVHGGIVVPTLKQQLETGLLARTPSERAFVSQVVARVEAGDLPLSLVQGTFLWARAKRPYPMPFFERALKLRAKAVGIAL